MGAMFAFLAPGARDTGDPLTSVRSVTAWLRELPSLDIVARQALVLRAFDAMRQSRRPIDFARAQAVEYLDAALGADRRQLFRQYVESLESAPKVSERIWQASLDLAQAFIGAYQALLEAALVPAAYGRWKPHVPIMFARLIHYYGTDAKLRVSRHERESSQQGPTDLRDSVLRIHRWSPRVRVRAVATDSTRIPADSRQTERPNAFAAP